jgi:Uma2 family endonuclease
MKTMSSPRGEQHWLETRVCDLLSAFVDARGVGWVLRGPAIYTRRGPDTVRTPAVAFASRARFPDRPPQGRLTIPPELVVEILSPENRWSGLRPKIAEYFAAGVEQVWVVSPDDEAVLVFRSATVSRRAGREDTVAETDALPGFGLHVADLFT